MKQKPYLKPYLATQMKIQFKLTKKIQGKKSPILLVIYNKYFLPNGTLYYGTGRSIIPDYFDGLTQRPTKNKILLKGLVKEELRELNEIEDKLNLIQAKARFLCDQFPHDKSAVNKHIFKQKLKSLLGTHANPISNESTEISINDYINQYITDLHFGKRLTEEGNCLKAGSIKNYETFFTQFKLFQKQQRRQFYFSDVSRELYKDFIQFLNSKAYSTNSIGKHIVRFKKILRDAKSENLYLGSEHEQKYFKAPEEATDAVYLTSTELQKIKQLDLSSEPSLELHRDIFLIGCHTAQRISDYKNIMPQNITNTATGVRIIKIKQIKTGNEVQIPISKELDLLLKKYEYHLPKIYDQQLNESLKVICKRAEITDKITIQRTRGGRKERIVLEKNELVKSHTARRTGATNMYLAGIPTLDIMKITGHKKESNFLKYICVTNEEVANALASHPYFQ